MRLGGSAWEFELLRGCWGKAWVWGEGSESDVQCAAFLSLISFPVASNLICLKENVLKAVTDDPQN